MTKTLRPSLILAAVVLPWTTALRAQAVPAAPAVQLAPLRVTADLWESPLDRIPASVSVYDGTGLREGVRHFGDLVDQIPNLTWTGGTSRPRFLQIRGIGDPDAVAASVSAIVQNSASTIDVKTGSVVKGAKNVAIRATGEGAANFAGFIPRSGSWGWSLTRPKYVLRMN